MTRALEAVGGKIDSIYYTFGDYDVVVIVELPSHVAAATVAFNVTSTGLVRTKTTPLLTIEETDQALEKTIEYRPPGR